MIAAESKLLTYLQAADPDHLNLAGTDQAKIRFIQRLVAAGDLVVTKLGSKTPRISELDLQTFKNNCRALEKTKKRK